MTSCLPPGLMEGSVVIECKPYGQIVFLFCQYLHTSSSTDRCHMNVMMQGTAGPTHIPSMWLAALLGITYPHTARCSVVKAILLPRFFVNSSSCWNSVAMFYCHVAESWTPLCSSLPLCPFSFCPILPWYFQFFIGQFYFLRYFYPWCLLKIYL